MKSRYSTYDVICCISELQTLWNLRVNQVYDIDHKTYLIKLQDGETKALLLLESGIRIHTTSFEWPKNTIPSGFCMKLRKHIRNKRLKSITQVGIDRIVDMQFGTGDAAYHVILELYDKGNIILADFNYVIINILRPHTEGEKVRFAVREIYPSDRGKQCTNIPSKQEIEEIFQSAKPDDTLKKILNPHLVYGSVVLDHVLLRHGFPINIKLKNFDVDDYMPRLFAAFADAEEIIHDARIITKGYIIQKAEKKINDDGVFYTYQEFHPMLFNQHENEPYIIFDTFNQAVDEFFSKLENQKIELKGVQQERAAMKKLENVRKDHEKRISNLVNLQEGDKIKAELITRNQELVDRAIIATRQLLANKTSWDDIESLIKEATLSGDEVARIIKKLKLNINSITLLLSDPYSGINESSDEDDSVQFKPTLVDVDLDHTAFANAKKYYDQKRQAVSKQMKTIESEGKALKSAEKKTKQTLKEVKAGVIISKARKVYWFEKFYWFISSENYLVIGGRDQQQNELIAKRYLRQTDIYVHAGTSGASSVVIKNPTNDSIPPKTLNEAGTMAICYSTAWEAKVVTSAWWVYAHQVSKTAPTGEYLTTGSFIIRGKKNFLPQSNLVMGFGFLFKLEDGSVDRHKFERRRKTLEEEEEEEGRRREKKEYSVNNKDFVEQEQADKDDNDDDELEISLSDKDESGEDNDDKDYLPTISEDVENITGEISYPDTEIIIEHTGDEYNVKFTGDTSNAFNEKTERESNVYDSETDTVYYLGDDKPVVIKSNIQTKKTNGKNKNENATENTTTVKIIEKNEQQSKQTTQLKRGQKGKLKKIKEKYKDQDEEERRLKMGVLQSAGSEKEKKKKGKKGGKSNNQAINQTKPQWVTSNPAKAPPALKMVDQSNIDSVENPVVNSDDEGENETSNEPVVTADVEMLDSLTGQPVPEDELLFAIPVVTPYNVLTNYKFKVKLTPGTGKRGKASKVALSLFLKDKAITQKEKDLLKFVKDQDLARNIPGKVKLSAPQLSKHKM